MKTTLGNFLIDVLQRRGPHSAVDLAVIISRGTRVVSLALHRLTQEPEDRRRVYIASWTRDSLNARRCWRPVFAAGKGVNALRPSADARLDNYVKDAECFRWLLLNSILMIEQNGLAWALRTRMSLVPDSIHDVRKVILDAIEEDRAGL